MARVARAIAMATKRAMVKATAQAMAAEMRVAREQWQQQW
jgi:hypothetical protein